jgi:hypothetical protein
LHWRPTGAPVARTLWGLLLLSCRKDRRYFFTDERHGDLSTVDSGWSQVRR